MFPRGPKTGLQQDRILPIEKNAVGADALIGPPSDSNVLFSAGRLGIDPYGSINHYARVRSPSFTQPSLRQRALTSEQSTAGSTKQISTRPSQSMAPG